MHFRARRKCSQDVSLSDLIETGTDGNALSLMDVIQEDEDLLEQVDARENARQLYRALDALTPQEKQVVIHRYGLYGHPARKQWEVAKTLNISRSYVSRIEKRALEKLRGAMEGCG